MVTKKTDEDEVVEIQEGKAVYRVSFSIDPSLRRKIRIASALHDMDQGEWMASIISKAASKALEDVRQ